MKKFTTFLFFFFVCQFVSRGAWAQLSEQQQQSIISDQNRVLQRDQQIEQAKIQEKDLKTVAREYNEIKDEEEEAELESESGQIVQNLKSLRCYRINKIEVSENKILSKADERSFTAEYEGKCLPLRQIAKIGRKITDHLIAQGYVTSRAEVPPQSLVNGKLMVKIFESKLEDITFNQEKFFDRTQKFMAFGLIERGDVLNLHPIEQALDQVNRLPSNNAVIKVLPGKEENSSIVNVENNPKKRLRLNASYDNNGNKLTGARRETIGLAQDNLFWLNDNLTLSRTANDFDQSRKKDGGNNSYSGSFSVPFTWYTLTLSYSKSSYFFWSGDTTRFKSSGETSTKTAALERVFIKNKDYKLAANLSFMQRYNRNFIGETKVDVSSRKASIASASLPFTLFFSESTLFLKPSYSKSLAVIDARKDQKNLARNSAHAEFALYEFYANYSQKLKVREMPFTYNLSFDSQLADKRLYGIDQFSVGGIYTVRGFKNGSISGDSGYDIRNEITFNLGQVILPKLHNPKPYLSQLSRLSFTPFYDYGYVRQKGGVTSGRLSGAGFKIAFSHQNFNAALTFSHALSKSQLLAQNRNENNAIFFNVSTEFGFF